MEETTAQLGVGEGCNILLREKTVIACYRTHFYSASMLISQSIGTAERQAVITASPVQRKNEILVYSKSAYEILPAPASATR